MQSAMPQGQASHANASQSVPAGFSSGHPLLSQPLQPHLQSPAMSQYQAQDQHGSWQSTHAQQQQPQYGHLAYSGTTHQAQQQQQQQQQYSGQPGTYSLGQNADTAWSVTPAAPQHPPVSSAAVASSTLAAPCPPVRGFTHNQRNVLRNQILAFRRIKVSRLRFEYGPALQSCTGSVNHLAYYTCMTCISQLFSTHGSSHKT